MKKKDLERLIVDYLDEKMSSDQESEFLNFIKRQGYNIDEIKELSSINNQLDEIPAPEPCEKLDANFYNMLEHIKYEEQMKNNWIQELALLIYGK